MEDPDDAKYTAYASEFADALERALPAWVVACVSTIHTAWAGSTPPEVLAAAAKAGEAARVSTGGAVRALVLADIDEQRTTPLELVRRAVRYPTAILADAGVPPVERDDDDEARFPDDVYGLTPASFADIHPVVGERAIAWGAAKAFTHRRRHAPPVPAAGTDGRPAAGTDGRPTAGTEEFDDRRLRS